MTLISNSSPTTSPLIQSIGEAGSLTPDQTIEALNARGFVISIFQGSFASSGLVDSKVPKHLWHGSIYSAERHNSFSKVRRELSYEEQILRPDFYYQLVAHQKESYQECIEALWQEYLKPTLPPRPVRSSLNPAFNRHKKERSRLITDDDLMA